MFSKKIQITNFKLKKKNKKIYKILSALLKDKSQLILSMGAHYKNNYNRNKIIRTINPLSFFLMGFASNFTRVIFLVFPFIVNFLNTNHINANEWLFLASIGSLLTAVIDFGYSRIVFREALKKTYSRKLKYSKIIVRYF